MIAVCLLIDALFVHGDLRKLRGDALASVLYVNNWHQILAGHSYFAAFGRPSPLQHYWSLSVEEQFYLLWPLVLMGGLALRRRGWIALAATAAIAGSAWLMATLYHGGTDPSRVYYGTDTRAAPLMIGAILAFAWPLGRLTGRTGRGAGAILDAVGIVALGALVLVMHGWHDYDPFLYRGGFLIAGGIAAALIAAAVHPACGVGRVLSVRPLRWLGQRSYGIYLWHWPVMALTRPGIDLTWSSGVLVGAQVAVTLVLATLSYRFVEMPVRRGEASRWISGRLERRRPGQGVAVATAGALGLFGAIAALMLIPVAPARSPLSSLASAAAARASLARATVRTAAPASGIGAPVSGPLSERRSAAPAGRRTPGVQATIVADSVGETIDEVPQAVQALTQGRHLRLELKICRRLILPSCTYRGQTPPPALSTITSLGRRIGPVLIVDVGYDDDSTGYELGIDRIIRAALAQGAREVVWLTLRDVGNYASTFQATNDTIRRAARRWPQLRIADWNAYSAGKPWFADDVHPNPEGAVALARFLRSYVPAGA